MKKYLFILTVFLFALSLKSEKIDKISQNFILKYKENPEQLKSDLKRVHQRVPKFKQLNNVPKVNYHKKSENNNLQFLNEFPKDVIYPGEFEEVQAILVSWPYITVDTLGYLTEPLFDGIGIYYDEETEEYYLGPVESFIDTLDFSPYPPVFSKLVYDINNEAEVWINVWYPQDSTILKNYLKRKGYELKNYRFFVNPGNSYWARDFGPVAFYYGKDDNIGFLDLEYYGGRPLDDEIPLKIAMQNNIPIYRTSIEFEGGNILVDGLGTMVTTSAVYVSNADTYGQYFIGDDGNVYEYVKKALKSTQVNDSLKYLFNLKNLRVLPTLRYDGGTGHIDLYADMWDENNFVFTQYPEEMKTFVDYVISKRNIDTILSMVRLNGQKYRGSYIPLPRKDDGSWYINNDDYQEYTRSYSNHLIVNKAIIQPVFADDFSGDKNQMMKDLEVIQSKYPGYKIYPIDVRAFDGFGGAIHCITKQIPAENPIRIYHNPINPIVDLKPEYAIEATIQNKSGIFSAKVYWRYKNDPSWQIVNMDAKENNDFLGIFTPQNDQKTIEYYIEATSNNGKTITKPMTAPNGFYSFTPSATSVVDYKANALLGEFYPNPANIFARIEIEKDVNIIQIQITNINGEILYAHTIDKIESENAIQINTTRFDSGIYFVHFTTADGTKLVRKLVVIK